MLWALSPVGVYISNFAFHTPNVFWKMFWPAPLLLLLGLMGLQLRQSGRSGLLEKVGFLVTIVGLLMVIAGDVGLYWLGIDDIYILTAPAYRVFRIGLLVLAVGSILFAVTSPREGAFPTWACCLSSSGRCAACLLRTGLWLLRRRYVGLVRCRVGVARLVSRDRGLPVFLANETYRPRGRRAGLNSAWPYAAGIT